MTHRVRALLAAAAVLAVAGAASGAAAPPTVTRIELASPQQLPRERVMAAIGPLAGQPFSRWTVRQSLDRLWGLGLFDAISVDEHPDGTGVRLVYQLRRRPWLARLAWTGDLGLDRAEIAAATRLAPEGDAGEQAIAAARDRILSRLRQDGYLGARVDAVVTFDTATSGRDVTFSIAAGRHARIGRVSATGAGQVPVGDVLRAFDLAAGDRYRERAVKDGTEAATRFLRDLGYLDARVVAVTSPWDPAINRVSVELRITEGLEYHVSFSGNAALSDRQLARRADLAEQGPIDTFILDSAARAIETAYRERGYALARATADMRERDGARDVHFTVQEGPRVIVADVTITGSTEISADRLLEQMKLRPGRWFATPYRADLLEADVRAILAFLRARGFADARVGPPQLTWSDDQSEVRIAIPVAEGPRLRVGSVRVDGATLVPMAAILAALPLTAGGAWDAQRADEGTRVIDQLYRRRGAFGTEVTADVERDGYAMHVTYRIVEGPQTRIGRVLVSGALLTREHTIRERLPFAPGDLLDPELLVKGGNQLTDLGVFDRVDVEPVDPPATPYADVEVTLRERKPWRLDFGLGYATDEGGRGFAEIGYENLFGTGRALRLRQKVNAGGEASAFGARTDLIYREPWALGTIWDGEARLFWEYRENLGYNFERAGFLATLAGDIWRERVRGLSGSVWYRWYDIHRFDVDPDLADSTIVPGRNRVASVAGSLTWDLRDAPLDPHRGSLQFASLETAAEPLGGNVSFVKARLETAWAFSWLPPTVVAVAARLGLATPFAGSPDLPIEDRFYAGGANTVRGYREQRVGPLDANGNPTGGNGLVVLNAEWRFPIWRFIGGSVFADAGAVTTTVSQLALSQFRVGVGGGLRLNTPVGPVRFDFGYALTPIAGENPFQFYVALGNPF